MKRLLSLILGLLLITTPVWGLGLAPTKGTVTSASDTVISASGIRLFQVSYTTGTGGDINLFTCSTGKPITGWILLVETDPGATAPTDNYDITLLNANGRDVMGGALTNRDTANTEAVLPLLNGNYSAVWNEGPLTITVTAAGDSKTIELLIYYLP